VSAGVGKSSSVGVAIRRKSGGASRMQITRRHVMTLAREIKHEGARVWKRTEVRVAGGRKNLSAWIRLGYR
jgi:hypothetical protein